MERLRGGEVLREPYSGIVTSTCELSILSLKAPKILHRRATDQLHIHVYCSDKEIKVSPQLPSCLNFVLPRNLRKAQPPALITLVLIACINTKWI